jgi:hypothetical protein
LAAKKRKWDADAAEKRVRRWAHADDAPNDRYRRAFLWYDAGKKENFGSYKFAIADVVGGRLKAVPRGISAAAGVVQGARGGANVPRKDVPALKGHLGRYYEKMNEAPPWEAE